jgi:hypothetical protein
MIKRLGYLFIFILPLTVIVVSCSLTNTPSQDEALAQTIAAIADEKIKSTPSKVPPTAAPSYTPTETPTQTPTVTASPTPEPSPTPDIFANYPAEGYGPLNFPSNINPLTGYSFDDQAILDRRPISVKISNFPRGIRPQWGLSLADHVFEYYHEAGSTRFHAIYYGNDVSQIGPIRSARFSDKDIVEMYKSFFAYGSADYRVRTRLAYSDFTSRMATITDYPCPPTELYPLCRIEQTTWNHLVTSTEALYQHFENEGVPNGRQNLDGLSFNLTSPSGGRIAFNLVVRYSLSSYHKWIYDTATGKYFRHQDVTEADLGQEVFEPTIDRLNGRQITADNVVVLLANHQYYSVTPEMIEIPFDGYGKAYIFRDGMAYLVNWGRLVNSEIIFLSFDDGSRFPLKPGNTWFSVIGSTSQIQSESPDWRFKHLIP